MAKAIVSQTGPLLSALSQREVGRSIYTFFYLRFLKEISGQEHDKAPVLLSKGQ